MMGKEILMTNKTTFSTQTSSSFPIIYYSAFIEKLIM